MPLESLECKALQILSKPTPMQSQDTLRCPSRLASPDTRTLLAQSIRPAGVCVAAPPSSTLPPRNLCPGSVAFPTARPLHTLNPSLLRPEFHLVGSHKLRGPALPPDVTNPLATCVTESKQRALVFSRMVLPPPVSELQLIHI